MKRFLFSIYFFVTFYSSYGQVSVQFFPELNGKSIDGLFNVRILNSGPVRPARLNLTVRENNKQVLTIRTPVFNLTNGLNVLPVSAVKGSSIQFSNTSSGQFINRNSFFPYGTFEYCYTVESLEMGSWEECTSYEVLPAAPMLLSAPYDGDKLCEKRPVFLWQPSLPVIAGTQYQLVLVVVKSGQNATEALNYNLPLINQEGLQSPVLSFPSIVPQLEESKKYAWQVTAYKGRTILNRSEVWAFTVGCEEEGKEEKKNTETDMGYRDIEDLARGNNYITFGILKVAVTNSYAPQKLRYEINCITDPSVKLKKLPEIQLTSGRNKILIDLSENKSLKDNYTYILKLWLPDGSAKQLRFIYKKL